MEINSVDKIWILYIENFLKSYANDLTVRLENRGSDKNKMNKTIVDIDEPEVI